MITGVSWTVVLTGAEDETTDLTLRVSNLTMTLRESTSSRVSMVVHPAQMEDVIARPNGLLKIYKTALPGGSPVLVVTANQQQARLDAGGGSQSYQLSGTTSASFTPFSAIDLFAEDVVTDRLLASGLKSWNISPLLDISPGDTINYYGVGEVFPTAYEIDLVSISASAAGTQMTITQAAA